MERPFPITSFEDLLVSHTFPGFVALLTALVWTDFASNHILIEKALLLSQNASSLIGLIFFSWLFAIVLGIVLDALRHATLDDLLFRCKLCKSMPHGEKLAEIASQAGDKAELVRHFSRNYYLWAELWGNMSLASTAFYIISANYVMNYFQFYPPWWLVPAASLATVAPLLRSYQLFMCEWDRSLDRLAANSGQRPITQE